MRKYLFILSALILASCGKEVPVTREHPVSAEFEQTPAAGSLAVVWASCPEGAVSGEALDAALKASGADVALCLTDISFEGGAGDWFLSHYAGWPFGNNPLGAADGEKYLFAAAKDGITLGNMAVGDRSMLMVSKGKFSIALGALASSDCAALLQETWFAGRDTDWIYALSLPDSSPALEDATFTDCLYGQFGPVAMAGSRSDYLYTSAGIWSLLRNMSMESLEGGKLYGFTIRAEESRL